MYNSCSRSSISDLHLVAAAVPDGLRYRWEEMQKVFREEIDKKHLEHIAFRREQEAWRTERKSLDMDIQVLHV